jgi:hypothetical protein
MSEVEMKDILSPIAMSPPLYALKNWSSINALAKNAMAPERLAVKQQAAKYPNKGHIAFRSSGDARHQSENFRRLAPAEIKKHAITNPAMPQLVVRSCESGCLYADSHVFPQLCKSLMVKFY